MVKLYVNAVFTKIYGLTDEAYIEMLSDTLSYKVAGYFFSQAYQNKHWDGRKRLLMEDSDGCLKTFSGLVKRMIFFFKKQNIKYKIIKQYSHEGIKDDDVELKDLKMRNYQQDVVAICKKKKRGIIKSPTGSGKCCTGDTMITIEYDDEEIDLRTKYICEDCHKTFYTIKIKQKNIDSNKLLCQKCSCKYTNERNKNKMKKIIKEKYDNGEMEFARKKSKENITQYNKYIHPIKLEFFSKEKKEDIANKKRKTFYSKTIKEQNEINFKRTKAFRKYNLKHHEQKNKFLQLLSKQEMEKLRLYGDNWLIERYKILKKVNYKCQRCYKKKKLDVHHSVPYVIRRKNIELIALCRSCHTHIDSIFMKEYDKTNNIKIAQQKSLIGVNYSWL